MEPASFAVGVVGLAGLFSSCLDAVDRAQAYRSYAADSKNLNTQLNAAKVRLENWGRAVGFNLDSGEPSDEHHVGLDDEKTQTATREVFRLIKDICDPADAFESSTSSHVKPPPPRTGTVEGLRGRPLNPLAYATPGGKRRKLAWALGARLKRTEQVELVKELVQALHNLVPPSDVVLVQCRALPLPLQTNPLVENTWSTEFRQLIARLEAKARRDVHAWLRHTPDERYEDSLRNHLQGTCSWILDQPSFLDWIPPEFPSDAAKVLWIYGPAGFGKTILCAHIVEHATKTLETPVARFFFSSEADNREDPFAAVRSWISQLVSQHDGAFEYVLSRQEADPDPTATRHTIMSLFEELVRIVPGCTFVLDGVDECTRLKGSANSAVEFLKATAGAVGGTQTRILVVSRFLVEIQDALEHQNHDRIALSQYGISPHDLQSDVAAYSEHIVESKLKNKNAEVRISLSDTLAKRCEGQFLWLKLQGESLRRGMTKKQLHDTVEQTPTDLDHVYDQSWGRIMQLREADRQRAFALFRWAALAFRPLTVVEVNEAILIEESDELDVVEDLDLDESVDEEYVNTEVLGLCAPLLEVRSSTDFTQSPGQWTIHIPHFTIKEYLLRSLPTPSWVRPNDALLASHEILHNTVLANVCLNFIRCPGILASNPLRTTFHIYAATSWHRHLNSGLQDHPTVIENATGLFTDDDSVWDAWRTIVDAELGSLSGGGTTDSSPAGPLYYAVKLQVVALIARLVEDKSFDVNEGSILQKHSPLVLACSKGLTEIVVALLEAGADVMARDLNGITPLRTSSYSGHAEIVSLLLDKGADIDFPDDAGQTALHAAADNGQLQVVQLLLEKGASPTSTDKKGRTPLYSAADNGYPQIVRLLLERGAIPTTVAEYGWTPLSAAAESGHSEVVKLFLKEEGVDVNSLTLHRWTALSSAVYHGHTEVVRVLLDAGADFTIANDGEEWRPLDLAAAYGYAEIVRILLEKGADPDMTTTARMLTPLYTAASHGRDEVVKLLVEAGADITRRTPLGSTPFEVAVNRGHVKVAEVLFERLVGKGFDITVASDKGWAPLDLAAQENSVETVTMLLEKGAPINGAAGSKYSPLYLAASQGNVSVMRFLLEKGADITATGQYTHTALNVAATNGFVDVVEILLEHGADVLMAAEPRKHGVPPVHFAANRGHVRVFEVLLRAFPAGLRYPDVFGRDALFLASLAGRVEVVRFYLELAAHRDVKMARKDWHGATALFAAVRNGHLDVVKLLLDSGLFEVKARDGFGHDLTWWAKRTGNAQLVALFPDDTDRTDVVLTPEEGQTDDHHPPSVVSVACDPEGSWCKACTLTVPSAEYAFRCEACEWEFGICEECVGLGIRCPCQSGDLILFDEAG